LGTLKDTASQTARAAAGPALQYANRRFEDLHHHLDNRIDELQAQVAQTLAETRALRSELDTDVQVIAELTITLQRFAERFGDRVDELLAAVERVLVERADAGKDG
jgi:regulator of replication initiation timing